jgi:hypothetical protein
MTETNSKIGDRFLRGVRTADLITGGLFAPASLDSGPECADRRALTGTAGICSFSPIFYRHIVDKRIIKSEHSAWSSLGQTAPRYFANS